MQVGYSAPTQSGIVDEVGLSISQVSDFLFHGFRSAVLLVLNFHRL